MVDVGSNTVRLIVVDAEGGVPLPVHTAKWKLRLSEQVTPGGPVPERCVGLLADAVQAAGTMAKRWGASTLLAFATAVVRNAANRAQVLQAVRERSGTQLCTLPGEVEAELTYLAARRWLGWRCGPFVLLDIGGGSLEVAFGRGRLPDFAASLPLGANRLTREFFADEDPPSPHRVEALRGKVRDQLEEVAARIRWEGPSFGVATSRTFQQLARLCGAAPGRDGPFVARELVRKHLGEACGRLAVLPSAARAELSGISAPRAAQSLAGAVVGHTAMKLTGLRAVAICPWAVRQGVVLRYLEDGPSWWAGMVRHSREAVATGVGSSDVPLGCRSVDAELVALDVQHRDA